MNFQEGMGIEIDEGDLLSIGALVKMAENSFMFHFLPDGGQGFGGAWHVVGPR
jgi:hypothetical protein